MRHRDGVKYQENWEKMGEEKQLEYMKSLFSIKRTVPIDRHP